MSKKSNNPTTWDLLGILFLGLKLTNQIDWHYAYVLMPFYIPFVGGVIYALIHVSEKEKKDKKYFDDRIKEMMGKNDADARG